MERSNTPVPLKSMAAFMICIRIISVLLLMPSLTGCEKLGQIEPAGEGNYPETTLVDQPAAALIAEAVYDEMNAKELVGLQVSIADSSGETWTLSAGTRDIERTELIHDTHTFRIGSVSKIFTATVVVGLAEQGMIDLDRRISEYFTGFPNAEKITIRQLLNHTSGLRDIFSLPEIFIQSSMVPDKQWDHRHVAETCLKSPLLFNPGENSHYSSANYILAALVAEQASGKEFKELYHEMLFDPLDLRHSLFVPYENHSSSLVSGFVHHFALSLKEWYRHTPEHTSWSTAAHASGALVSNASDLARFGHLLFHGNIVSPNTLDEMTTFFGDKGLGLFEYNVNGRTHWGHEGEIMGFECLVSFSPQDQITYAICCNTTPYDIYRLLDRIELIIHENSR